MIPTQTPTPKRCPDSESGVPRTAALRFPALLVVVSRCARRGRASVWSGPLVRRASRSRRRPGGETLASTRRDDAVELGSQLH